MSTYLPEPTERSGSSRLTGIASLVMTGTLAGFLIASYIPDALGVDSRVATVPFRALMLLLFLLYALYKVSWTPPMFNGTVSHRPIACILLDGILLTIHRRCSVYSVATRQPSCGGHGRISLRGMPANVYRFVSNQRYSAVQKGAYVEHAFVGCVQSGFDASD